MNYINNIIQHLKLGNAFYLLHGDVSDLTVDRSGNIIKVEDLLADRLIRECKLQLVKYCPASGAEVVIGSNSRGDNREQYVNAMLREAGFFAKHDGLLSNFNNALRGLFHISKIIVHRNPNFRICFLIEFSHHLLPNVQPGFQTDEHLVAIELLHKLTVSNDFIRSGNVVLINSNEAIPELEKLQLQTISNWAPGREEKKKFVDVCFKKFPDAKFEKGIEQDIFIQLSENTSNRTTFNLIRGSQNSKSVISLKNIREQREIDILTMSEGMLRPVNPDRLQNPLIGIHANVNMKTLQTISSSLKSEAKNTPANILLCGPKSSGKTDFLEWIASVTNMPAFYINSPKAQFVGETERRVRKLFNIMYNLKHASIFMCDEIDLAFNLDRNQQFGDSGASEAIIGAFQDVLSDRSRCGKNIIVGTTNDPSWGASLLERWEIIPILPPHPEDYPSLITTCVHSLNGVRLDERDPDIQEAANILFHKRLTPRLIIQSLSRLSLFGKELSGQTILDFAKEASPDIHFPARLYCEFKARLLSSPDYWPENFIQDYRFPDYYEDVLGSNGKIDLALLDKKVNELLPYAKI